MDVRHLNSTEADESAWTRYVIGQPQATSDHAWAWRRVLEASFGYAPHYLAAVDDGRIVGVLPLFRVPRGLRRAALSSVPFGSYGGICADSDDAARALLDAACDLMHRLGSDHVELRHRTPLADERLTPHTLYSRFSLPLTGDPAGHLREMSSTARSKIKKATRAGLQLLVSRDLDGLYAIHVHTTHRLGSPCFPRRYFEMILEAFGDQAAVHYAMLNGQPVAFDLLVMFKSSMVFQYHGSLASSLDCFPNNFLLWHAIEQGCLRGMTEVDYCRSRRDSGTAQFKRMLRLVEQPLGYQYAMANGHEVPQRHPSNPKYQWMIRMWQRLPGAVTRVMGPALIRYLA